MWGYHYGGVRREKTGTVFGEKKALILSPHLSLQWKFFFFFFSFFFLHNFLNYVFPSSLIRGFTYLPRDLAVALPLGVEGDDPLGKEPAARVPERVVDVGRKDAPRHRVRQLGGLVRLGARSTAAQQTPRGTAPRHSADHRMKKR
jgi:hypothetical protein